MHARMSVENVERNAQNSDNRHLTWIKQHVRWKRFHLDKLCNQLKQSQMDANTQDILQ